MSERNDQIVRRLVEALVQRDGEALDELAREHLSPDFESESVLTGRLHQGADALQELAAEVWQLLGYVPAIEEFIDLGERVVCVLRGSRHPRRGGAPVSSQIAIVWSFDEETIVGAKSFPSRAKALEEPRLRSRRSRGRASRSCGLLPLTASTAGTSLA